MHFQAGILVLISLSFTVGQDHDRFIVRGSLRFSSSGVYTHIPEGSCLRIKVIEGIMCEFGCTPKVSGKAVIKDIKISENNTLEYELTCKHLGAPVYFLSATLNVGWCPTPQDGFIKRGDYQLEFLGQLTVPHSAVIKNDKETAMTMELYRSPELCGRFRCDVSMYDCKRDSVGQAFCQCKNGRKCPETSTVAFTTTTTAPANTEQQITTATLNTAQNTSTSTPRKWTEVHGSIKLPLKGLYTQIPAGSCLHIRFNNNDDCMDDCLRKTMYHRRINIVASMVQNKSISYRVNTSSWKPDAYGITATLNIGWCSQNEDDDLKETDAYTDTAYQFRVTGDAPKVIKMDLQLKENRKYLCGEKLCHKNEDCEVNKGKTFCRCNKIYACGDLHHPDWICANNGYSYVSECWMRASDCFSGNIRKVKIGKCGESQPPTTTSIPRKWTEIHGSIRLPAKGSYTQIPAGSCLHIRINNNNDCMDDCPRKTMYHRRINIVASMVQDKSISYSVNVSSWKPDAYGIRATLNIGWCSQNGDYDLKETDAYTDTAYQFRVTGDAPKVFKMDVQLKENRKYLCGENVCHKNEDCEVRRGKSFCRCNKVYACADLRHPDWICANNGYSYISECWMRARDCFSGNIRKVKDGKCGKSQPSRWINSTKGVVFCSAGALAFLMIVVLAVFFKYKCRINAVAKESQKTDLPPKYESVERKKKLQNWKEMEIASEKEMQGEVNIPDVVFDRPPDYEEALEFENKTYEM